MNYIEEAEKYLKYYSDMYIGLKEMDRQISRLLIKSGPGGYKSPALLDPTGVKSSDQDDAINTIFKLQKLIENRNKTEQKLKEIEKHLEDISKDEGCELYGLVLRRWYIERRSKEDIAEEVGYSSRQSIYTIRAEAIRKFAVRLFGIGAVENM